MKNSHSPSPPRSSASAPRPVRRPARILFVAALTSLLVLGSAPPASANPLQDLLGGVLGGQGSDEGPLVLDIGEGGINVGIDIGILPNVGLEVGSPTNPGVGLTIGGSDDALGLDANAQVDSGSISVGTGLQTPSGGAAVGVDVGPDEGIGASITTQAGDAASIEIQASIDPSSGGVAVDAGGAANIADAIEANTAVTASGGPNGVGAGVDACLEILDIQNDCELGSELLPGPLSDLLAVIDQILPGLGPDIEAALGVVPLGLCARLGLGDVPLSACASGSASDDPSDDPDPGNGGPGTPTAPSTPPGQPESPGSDTEVSLDTSDGTQRGDSEESAAGDPSRQGGAGLLPRTGGGISALVVGLILLGSGVFVRLVARARPGVD